MVSDAMVSGDRGGNESVQGGYLARKQMCSWVETGMQRRARHAGMAIANGPGETEVGSNC
jgi:hypothetical protein